MSRAKGLSRVEDDVIKAAFFDIDGTLLSFKTHGMPPSTRRALARLRERGIKTVISSGRPSYQLPEELRQGFDAYVSLSGQLCYDEHGIYHENHIPRRDVEAVVDRVKAGCFDVLVMQRDRAFANELSPRVTQTAQNSGLVYERDDIDHAFDAPVYQFCMFVGPEEEGEYLKLIPTLEHTRWTDLFCDILPAGGGKKVGVTATLERFGISPDEAVAFGDGENDLSMFDAVGTGVAMGNAWDAVKERADMVTDDVDHDGIWNACEKLGML